MFTTPPQSLSPLRAEVKMDTYTSFMLTCRPAASAKPLSIPAQALISLVQLLQCTMATGMPLGVVTMSISG